MKYQKALGDPATKSGKCVNYTLIEDVVYDGDFKSLDAIRSLIKRLRKKLPKDIIFNNLDEGYFIK